MSEGSNGIHPTSRRRWQRWRRPHSLTSLARSGLHFPFTHARRRRRCVRLPLQCCCCCSADGWMRCDRDGGGGGGRGAPARSLSPSERAPRKGERERESAAADREKGGAAAAAQPTVRSFSLVRPASFTFHDRDSDWHLVGNLQCNWRGPFIFTGTQILSRA